MDKRIKVSHIVLCSSGCSEIVSDEVVDGMTALEMVSSLVEGGYQEIESGSMVCYCLADVDDNWDNWYFRIVG